MSVNSPSSSSQKQTTDSRSINDHQTGKTQQSEHSLPIELHCQICEFLPVEKSGHFLQLNHKLSQLCLTKVRRQHQRWQQFRDIRLEFMFAQFHPEIMERVQTLEADCDNFDVNERFPWLEFEINEAMASDDLEMAQWIGLEVVRKAICLGTREKAMEHFLWCSVNLYNFLSRSKFRQEKSWSYYDAQFRRRIDEIRLFCRPQSFPSYPTSEWSFSQKIRQRLQNAYNSRLDGFKAQIDEIEKARTERLQKAPWMQKLLDWDGKVRENIQIMIKYWKRAQTQKNSFDPEKWLKELADEEKEETMKLANIGH